MKFARKCIMVICKLQERQSGRGWGRRSVLLVVAVEGGGTVSTETPGFAAPESVDV